MSDETTNGVAAPAAQQDAAGPAFTVEKVYVKDVSFEAPGAPAIFSEPGQPDLQLNLNQRVQRLNEALFEVVLGVTLTCKIGEKTAYVAEVQQAGVFALVVRQTVSDLIQAGGFPPFLLQPINFDALYGETLRQRQQQAEAGGADAALATPVGNA